ncbi:MAG: hypothetical protein U0R79_02245 [Propionicimonas sp.]
MTSWVSPARATTSTSLRLSGTPTPDTFRRARRAAVTARRVLWMNPVRPPPVVHKPAPAPEGQPDASARVT